MSCPTCIVALAGSGTDVEPSSKSLLIVAAGAVAGYAVASGQRGVGALAGMGLAMAYVLYAGKAKMASQQPVPPHTTQPVISPE